MLVFPGIETGPETLRNAWKSLPGVLYLSVQQSALFDLMQKIKELSIYRVLLIFLLGLLCGIQGALYLFDYYDDGIADYRSALIALGMIAVSLGFVIYTFRKASYK